MTTPEFQVLVWAAWPERTTIKKEILGECLASKSWWRCFPGWSSRTLSTWTLSVTKPGSLPWIFSANGRAAELTLSISVVKNSFPIKTITGDTQEVYPWKAFAELGCQEREHCLSVSLHEHPRSCCFVQLQFHYCILEVLTQEDLV